MPAVVRRITNRMPVLVAGETAGKEHRGGISRARSSLDERRNHSKATEALLFFFRLVFSSSVHLFIRSFVYSFVRSFVSRSSKRRFL